jgi:uncharacterized damage-inducible protein DinB
MTDLSKLLRHSSWANGIWIDFVYGLEPPHEFELKVMSHIILGERAWLQRIAGHQPNPEIWRILPDAELRQLHAEQRDTCDRLLGEDLDRRVEYRRFTGEAYESPIADILAHVATHAAHHRGQLARHVSTRGFTPPNTDFIQYCIANRL